MLLYKCWGISIVYHVSFFDRIYNIYIIVYLEEINDGGIDDH